MADSASGRLMALFRGYGGAHGTYTEEDWSEAKGKYEIKRTARTLREPVTAALWDLHIAGTRSLGIIPVDERGECVWGCIDVDQYDLQHAALVKKIESAKLPLIVCRSKSGGAHVFIFLSEPSPAGDVAAILRQVAATLGCGGSEIYPKQAKLLEDRGDLGSWLNMPYYGGDDSSRVGVKKSGTAMTLSEFLSVAEKARTSLDAVKVKGVRRRPEKGRNGAGTGAEKSPPWSGDDEVGAGAMDGAPPCLEILTESGFPEGTRNNGLFALGVYAKKRHGERWKEALEEFNRDYMRPPLNSQETRDVIKSLDRKEYNYRCKDEPICSHCNSVACRTRRFGVTWSEDFPEISGMVVMRGDPPVWFVNVEDRRMEVTTDDLQNYRRFHKVCMEQLSVCYKMLKQETWLAMVSEAMRSAVTVESPPEVGTMGHFSELLQDFCMNRLRGERLEEVAAGKPFHDPERTRHVFRLRDLQTHLERAGFKAYTRGQIVSKIRDMGGGHEFLNFGGSGVNVWWVPDTFRAQPVVEPRTPPEDVV